MDDIYYIKLQTGEELIGRVPVEYEKFYIIQDPLLIEMENIEGKVSMSLLNFIPFSRDNYIEVDKDKTIFKTPVSEETYNYYMVCNMYNHEVFVKNFSRDIKYVTFQMNSYMKNRSRKSSYIHPSSETEH